MRYYNLANLLSLSRILLTPPILLFLLAPWQEGYFVGGCLFLAAVVTDILDGYWARRRRSASSLGVFLDLIADKVLILAVLLVLVHLGLIPAWMAIVI
ncbi:MAG: CDP-alcohol phosphatidyltransferase family protein, partial [Dehalococcoidia bacterium]|nr:CDP-alcohol phosphatidyltransferase family protein [Dehalococcoidia bacterium]